CFRPSRDPRRARRRRAGRLARQRLGGHVGVFFAAEHPSACRSLVTIASPMNALTPADRRSIQLLRALHRLVG
ncbi:MAG TPA: hypothetical protein VK659_24445, partial [Asanoa sp.]|nr:hypothetical protein [Asanoa sp.]